MKHAHLIAFAILFLLQRSSAQATYQISKDKKDTTVTILKGLISKDLIKNDPAFSWYNGSQSIYYPDSTTVSAFKDADTALRFVVFGGTWCDDSQFILPKFFRLLEIGGIDDNRVVFFGVDHSKKTLGTIAETFNITKLPTIIVFKNGKERGRVAAYGKNREWDKELAGIIANNQ